MIENPQKIDKEKHQQVQNEQKPIQVVAKTLIKSQAKQKVVLKEGKSYDAIYKDINSILSQFDSSIGDCKKYNEAKIHRKYEIRISDLETQVRILRQKLKQQQNARSPSKKYIEDLVDQLVIFKLQNQRLKASIQQIKQSKQMLQQKILNLTISTPQIPIKIQKMLPSQRTARQTTSLQSNNQIQFNLKAEVINFLKRQQQIRKLNQQTKSKFESFLKKKLQVFAQASFLQFLSQINKWWISSEKANEDKLSSKLKSNVLSTLEDQIVYKKLPKLAVPYSMPNNFSQALNSETQIKKSVKKRQIYKNRQNYSTMEVISGVRQKYALK